MDDIWQYLKDCGRDIVLYGTGNGADKITDKLNSAGLDFAGVFASDGFVRERYFRGKKVMSYSECKDLFPDMTVLLCFGSARPEVMENVKRIAGECDFYAPDVPVYGDNIFDSAFYEVHAEELGRVRSSLSDEKSVTTFDDIIDFKLHGRIDSLIHCESDENEINEKLCIPDDAVYADVGAYTGDTVMKFAERYPLYRRIYAVEPDKRTYQKLCANTALMDNIILHNAAADEIDGWAYFSVTDSRGAHVSPDGEKTAVIRMDSVLKDGADFIKYDVEGNELKAINGTVDTIAEYKPKMLVSCYHRSEDMFTLPLKILSIRNDYKVYLRHFPSFPAWETQYYFI